MKPSTRMMLLAGRKDKSDRNYDRDRYREDMPENRYGGERMADRDGSRRYDRSRGGRIYNGGYDDIPYIGNAFYDRRGRRHYDNGRYAPMDAVDYPDVAPRQYPYRGYGMSQYDDEYDSPYQRNMMGFMHHKDGYEFEMDGRAGDMKGYAKGRVIPMMDESSKGWKKNEKVEPLDEETAEKWVKDMDNVDGTKGEHYSMEQTDQLMKQYKVDCDPVDFYAALNMVYSDYKEVAKKMGVDKTDFYVCMAKAWLDDPDIPGGGAEKLAKYYEYVVK